jgi:glycosyltransferase involved in cell wall biosynthesis
MAARRAGVPLVVTLHAAMRYRFVGSGVRGWALKRIGGGIEAAACRRADAVIALSAYVADRLREDGVARERVRIIPPGVNPAEFAAPAPDPFPDLGHPRVVYAGRLAYQKGVDMLIEAFARVRTPGARMLLVGDGPQRGRLEEAIRRHGLSERVLIAGFRPHREIPAILRHADIFCLPSRYEELSSALLEAMHAGVAIVATRVGGSAEAIGSAGRIVAAANPAALAEAIDVLLTRPDEAARLGSLAHERARRYAWPQLAIEILALYHSCERSDSSSRAGHRGRGRAPVPDPRGQLE